METSVFCLMKEAGPSVWIISVCLIGYSAIYVAHADVAIMELSVHLEKMDSMYSKYQ
jgi:hypothetical protein